jgi:membrane protein implicated in regulation of membrane protease activity
MHPSRSPRGAADLFWSFVLIVAPLLAGLLVNFSIGWWAGLSAFMIVSLVLGLAASRSGRDRLER